SAGSCCLHGPHQLAQKCTTVYLPRPSASVPSVPSARRNDRAGVSPTAGTGTTAAATSGSFNSPRAMSAAVTVTRTTWRASGSTRQPLGLAYTATAKSYSPGGTPLTRKLPSGASFTYQDWRVLK